MANRIEVPGQPVIETPNQTVELLFAIQQQLGQVTMALNGLAGQLDMGLRLGCGQMSKHEVKVKFEAHDKAVRLSQSGISLVPEEGA